MSRIVMWIPNCLAALMAMNSLEMEMGLLEMGSGKEQRVVVVSSDVQYMLLCCRGWPR